MVESTDEYTFLDLASEADRQRDRGSFHLFSEDKLRGEIWNLSAGDSLEQTQYQGAVLITGITGHLEVAVAGVARSMGPLSQLLINDGVAFSLTASGHASIQLVWSPSFQETICEGDEAS